MTMYECRVSETNINYYRVEAKSRTDAIMQVNSAIASGIMGNVALDNSVKMTPQMNYAVQLSPEGEVIT
tara:strand:- start:382 stop:588 length:207 start_codon:yes stop_codon:yes gene_type:complete